MTWDPADDVQARANRAGKVDALTAWCTARGLGPGTVTAWDEVTRRRAARAAAVNPPRATSPTWGMVASRLTDTTALADGMGAEHQRWCTGCPATDLHPTGNGNAEPLPVTAPPATGLAAPGALPAAPNFGSAPKGWVELVALGPVSPPRPCTVPGPDGPCGAPAVTRMMGAAGVDVWRCAGHPPGPGEWGHRLDHTPTVCRRPVRCYCGRCDVAVGGS